MHDVIIIGGSYAGLSAATQLARARKDILIIDAGKRRNRFAHEAHGFIGRDGASPDAIASEARQQVLAYPSVTWVEGNAVEAAGSADAFSVRLADGSSHQARRLVLALGVEDVLPDIPGLSAQWGTGAVTCPYCHGYELNRGALAVIATGPMAAHHAMVVSEWGPVTFFANGAVTLDTHERDALAARAIKIDDTPISRVEGEPGEPRVVTEDGRDLAFAGLFIGAHARLASDVAWQLGCAPNDTPVGRLIKVDGMQATSVPGVFACGDCATPMASIAAAVGAGAMTGAAAHRSLIFPETAARAA